MSAGEVEVSVIIPAHNAHETLPKQLAALARQQAPPLFEVIVVDDHSTDDTAAAASCAGGINVRVIPSLGTGANAARNTGARHARGELLAFTDADDEVHPNWLRAITNERPTTGIIGGTVSPLNRSRLAMPWPNNSLPTALGWLPYAVTTNLLLTKSTFRQLGGFDPCWPLGATDVEFSWRAQQRGIQLSYAPSAIVYHRERGDLRGFLGQAFRHGRGDGRLSRHFAEVLPAGAPLRHALHGAKHLTRPGHRLITAARLSAHAVGLITEKTHPTITSTYHHHTCSPSHHCQQAHPSPQVSVIVPTHNAEGTIQPQLLALARQRTTLTYEIIVVDDGSTDRTTDRARQLHLDLRLIESDHRGANHARNLGAHHAQAPVLAYCDADDIADPDWLDQLIEALDGADAVGGINEEHQLRHRTPQPLRRATPQTALAHRYLPRPLGANCAITSYALNALDGWDETIHYGGTDTDLFWRLQLRGYQLNWAPRALMYRRPRPTLRTTIRQHHRWGKGHVRLYKRYKTAGMPRSSTPLAIATWIISLALLPLAIVNRRLRWATARTLAERTGRLQASIQLASRYL